MTFSDRLTHLIAVVHPPGRGPYTNVEICQGVEDLGYQISASYLSQLRGGQRGARPSGDIVVALARFFGVHPAYFYDDELAADTNSELDLVAAVRDAGIERIATRSMGLSPNGIKAIEDMIEHIRKAEGVHGSKGRKKNRGRTTPSAE